jgi:hypothetical protein
MIWKGTDEASVRMAYWHGIGGAASENYDKFLNSW